MNAVTGANHFAGTELSGVEVQVGSHESLGGADRSDSGNASSGRVSTSGSTTGPMRSWRVAHLASAG